MRDDAEVARGPDPVWLGALSLVSAGLTTFQLALMQLLSFVQWYHFAYMMVSLALLGFGASGTLLSFLQRRVERRPAAYVGGAMILSGATMPLCIRLASLEALRFDLYLLFVEPGQLLRFSIAALLLWIPFLCGAFAIGAILTLKAAQSGRYYFANMLSSGVGGILGLLLIGALLPAYLPAASGVLPLAGGIWVLSPAHRRAGWGLGIVSAVLVASAFLWPPQWQPSQFKSLTRTMDLPGAEVVAQEPGIQGVVHVVQSPVLHSAPGLSLNYMEPLPRGPALFVNGDAYGMLMPPSDPGEEVWERATTAALPFVLNPTPQRVLLLSASGGSGLRLAAQVEAEETALVEENRAVVEILKERFPESWQQVIVNMAPRAYLERSEGSYDIIQFPTVGDFHGGVGLRSLGAEFLLTVQAFEEAWDHLGEKGVIAITVWLDFPERKPLRVFSTLLALLEEEGVEQPQQHIAAVRSWGAVTYCVTRQPLSDAHISATREWSNQWNFDPLLLPGLSPEEREWHHGLESRALFQVTDALLSDQPGPTLKAYAFDIGPTTDNRPFFSQFLRLTTVNDLLETFSQRALPFFEMGTFILAATLVLLSVLALLFILAPLLVRRVRAPGKGVVVAYFGALGLGFLFVEIVLMQAYHLVLGNPLFSAGAVIGGMLFFSGLGSLFSQRLNERGRLIATVAGIIAALLLMLSFLLLPAAQWLAGTLPLLRVPLAIILLAVISFPMGMPFPLALRLLNTSHPAQIPWAWGINGCFSVLSPPLATLLAVFAGLSSVVAIAAGLYAVAAVAILRAR